ncbi:MAG: hypothetical protein QNJ38_02555 [Prochloraceae cyanobacterium]|nr:hypothetical protein [Prochloraceae cyanobacterium]
MSCKNELTTSIIVGDFKILEDYRECSSSPICLGSAILLGLTINLFFLWLDRTSRKNF